MNQTSTTRLAVLSAIVIGAVNIASMGVVYVVFNSSHKAPESEFANTETGQIVTADNEWNTAEESTVSEDHTDSASDGTIGMTDDQDNQSDATGSVTNQPTTDDTSSEQANSASTGTAGSSGSTGGSTGNTPTPSSGGAGPSPAPTPTPTPPEPAPAPTPPPPPASLKKGSPCQSQTPPAGVCSSVLSFNNQKTGNANWDAVTMAAIKQGVADNDFVKLFRLNATDIFNSMQISLNENTWNGNATHGAIGGKMGASGQSEDTTFTLDWNGSKWIVSGVAQK